MALIRAGKGGFILCLGNSRGMGLHIASRLGMGVLAYRTRAILG